MVRKGLGVPKVDAGQEITLLAGRELLEHLLDVDVRHCAGLEVGRLENNYDLLHTADLRK